MKTKPYYTIGELSNICGISKRNLRFYDEKDLLKPSKRNQENNYRYYSQDKAIEALLIKELKKKGLGISAIKLLMKEKGLVLFQDSLSQTIDSLEKEKQTIEEQIHYTKKTYETVKESLTFLATSLAQPHAITIDYYPETYVFFTRYHSNHQANELFWERFAELTMMCEEEKIQITGPFSAIFYNHYLNQFFFEKGELEVFYPITPTNSINPRIRVIEKQLVLSKIVVGNYQSLLANYIELVIFSEEHDLQIIGPNFEEYLCDFSFGVDEDECVTRISFPIEMSKQQPFPKKFQTIGSSHEEPQLI